MLAFFMMPACTEYVGEAPQKSELWGTWNWESSSGGITGKMTMTPETEGYTKQIRLTPDGRYEELRDGEVVASARYTVVQKRTIFWPHEVISFAGASGQLSDEVIMKVTAGSLQLSDPFPDGFWHSYARAEQ
jgi:hypothetical protein